MASIHQRRTLSLLHSSYDLAMVIAKEAMELGVLTDLDVALMDGFHEYLRELESSIAAESSGPSPF